MPLIAVLMRRNTADVEDDDVRVVLSAKDETDALVTIVSVSLLEACLACDACIAYMCIV